MSDIFPFNKSRNIWSRLPITYRGAIIIAIPALCLMSTLGAWICLREFRISLDQQVEQREKVIEHSSKLLLNMLNAETGVRGYIMSRQEKFLEPYRIATSTQQTALHNLKKVTLKNPEQYQAIEKLVYQQLDVLAQAIAKNNLKPAPLAQEIALLSKGKRIMDELRKSLDELEFNEQVSLEIEQQKLKNVEEITTSIQWIAALASIIAYVGAVCLLRKLDRELIEREQQLRKSKTLIEAITTNVIDSVVTLNRQGKIETFNQAAAKMFGYEADEIVGQDMALLLSNPLSQELDKQDNITFLNPILLELHKPWVTIGYQKCGEPFAIEISISEIEPDSLLISIIRDISESEQAKATLQARADELTRLSAVLAATNLALEKQNQELEKFTYVASHDLKAPLRAIFSLSEWLEEDLKDHLSKESNNHIKLLRLRVNRLGALIDGLLAYSNLNRTKTHIKTVNTGELLWKIIESIDRPPLFKFTISPEMPIFKTKEHLLKKVFYNLIENAIKHHERPDGNVHIEVQDDGEFYQFSVTDDGPGIAPSFHKKVFVLFQTLEPRDVKESTGVGLAVAKKIVETEGGKIWLYSQEDEGSSFYFTWLKEPIESTQLARLTSSIDYQA